MESSVAATSSTATAPHEIAHHIVLHCHLSRRHFVLVFITCRVFALYSASATLPRNSKLVMHSYQDWSHHHLAA